MIGVVVVGMMTQVELNYIAAPPKAYSCIGTKLVSGYKSNQCYVLETILN